MNALIERIVSGSKSSLSPVEGWVGGETRRDPGAKYTGVHLCN